MKKIKTALLLLLMLTIGAFFYHRATNPILVKSNPPIFKDTSGDLHMRCADVSYSNLLSGLTATDDKDGNLTDQIMIDAFSPLSNGNKSTYKCVVFDSDGQRTEYNRTIIFDDYIPPRIYLSTPLLYFTSFTKNKPLRETLSAVDVLDGNISESIEFSDSDINYQLAGDYSVKVSIRNSLGDMVQYTLPVHVRENTNTLYITLSNYLVYCNIDSQFDPLRYVVETSNEVTATGNLYYLSVKSNVNTSKPGVYEVEYSLSGEKVAIPTKTYLIVIVEG